MHGEDKGAHRPQPLARGSLRGWEAAQLLSATVTAGLSLSRGTSHPGFCGSRTWVCCTPELRVFPFIQYMMQRLISS